ncbi:Actin-related protein 7 isoform 1 [Hibiscus syriacus]|uniref:Actin-related protein 7 isoform 1 n=1 Tax=Hibiscus syriacus TaxID=106335 RepID=A0A6A2YJH4_HIBSY|nr:Actin-related protein 7 isoform 1 [Hibiscus syriacus]
MDAVRDYDASWKSSTNWSIADGSLRNSVIFESTLASITGCDPHEPGVDDPNAVDSAPNYPLILCPTSPDSGPCEITIAFAQSHEVRQVYVRSTARVYEIYCAPKPQSSNEYLCTVRCGVACRDEEVLQAINFDESALADLKGGNTVLDEKRLKSDSNSTSTEDDWVEVKAPDTPLLDSGSNDPSNSTLNSSNTQDLYEATAEINDANPCLSITLRLLSLQNKGCVCVDEIYVFADPVDIADSETEVGKMGNAGGNSLMAMLAPTLLQLSKTAGHRRIENEEDLNIHEEIAATIELNQHEIPPCKHVASRAEVACRHTERSLNELVSRISRVEDLLLKFEENMLKPINSIDARLQRVEQQLGELTKNPKNSELPTCTGFYVPEFSCHNSDNCSSCNIGNESSVHKIYASHEKDIPSTNQLDESICSVHGTGPFPSLVVTAPDFSNADDEEDNHASETGSPKDKPKQSVSIDAALASALSNFLSSASMEPKNYTQALVVKVPEFSLEEDDSIDKMVSPESHFRVTSEPCCLDTRDGKDSMTASVPSDCSLEKIQEVTCSLNDDDSEQAAKEVVEDCQNHIPCHDTFDCIDTPAKHEHQIAGDMGDGEVNNATSKIVVLDEVDILNEYLENHIDDASDVYVESAPGNKKIKAEVGKQGPHEEFLQNILELSYASSVVDFETPILDVKFTSQDNSSSKSSLEALLSDMQVTDATASCSKKIDDGSQSGEDCKLISVEEREPAWPITGNFAVDWNGTPLNLEAENLDAYVGDGEPTLQDSMDPDGCVSSMLLLNLEVEKLDYPVCSDHEVGVTSLI